MVTNYKNWWESKRLKYNVGLIISGFLAFILLFFIEGYKNFTLPGFIFQIIGCGFVLGIANLLYCLGQAIDENFNKSDSEIFRKRLFNSGFIGSIVLPFLIPLLIIIFPPWDNGYKKVTQIPSEGNLYGLYELNESSKSYLKSLDYDIDSTFIVINQNNQCVLNKLPDLIFSGFGIPRGNTINEEGKWDINCSKVYGCELILNHRGFELTEKENRLSIMMIIGDPDERRGIVFEKLTVNK